MIDGSELARRLAVVQAALPGTVIRLRRMRRGLVTARRSDGVIHLTLHPDLAFDPECPVFLSAWVAHGGKHGTSQRLRDYLGTINRRRITSAAAADSSILQAMPTVGPAPSLETHVAGVHRRWFSDLDLPQFRWSRQPPRRRLRHLRFGCYRRQDPPVIEISPRLARPWTAVCFLEHVIFHELCHHRQARERIPLREGVHSPRFRSWESAYPDHRQAMHWEHLALPWLLDDTQPPWYPHNRSTTCE